MIHAILVNGGLDIIQIGQQLPQAFLILQAFLNAPTHFRPQHFSYIFTQIFFIEDAITLFIDALALRIEHIIIFQQMFAHIEIGAFDPGLGRFNQSTDKTMFNRHTLVDVKSAQDGFYLFSAKQTHQVIVQ